MRYSFGRQLGGGGDCILFHGTGGVGVGSSRGEFVLGGRRGIEDSIANFRRLATIYLFQ